MTTVTHANRLVKVYLGRLAPSDRPAATVHSMVVLHSCHRTLLQCCSVATHQRNAGHPLALPLAGNGYRRIDEVGLDVRYGRTPREATTYSTELHPRAEKLSSRASHHAFERNRSDACHDSHSLLLSGHLLCDKKIRALESDTNANTLTKTKVFPAALAANSPICDFCHSVCIG